TARRPGHRSRRSPPVGTAGTRPRACRRQPSVARRLAGPRVVSAVSDAGRLRSREERACETTKRCSGLRCEPPVVVRVRDAGLHVERGLDGLSLGPDAHHDGRASEVVADLRLDAFLNGPRAVDALELRAGLPACSRTAGLEAMGAVALRVDL